MLIARKLPLAAAILTIVSIGAASTAAIVTSSEAVKQKSFERLSAVADARRNELELFLNGIRSDLRASATSTDTATAINAFNNAWFTLSGATEELQTRYIANNPNEAGQRHLLDASEVGDTYDFLHQRFHDKFRQHLLNKGYYDIFLVNADGDVVYSVNKQYDYATNLLDGEWQKTGLADAYRQVMGAESVDAFAFEDFAPYAPSNGTPASFIAAPVFDSSGKIGALVFEIPASTIAGIIDNATGLGETGETVLVNRDGLLITDSAKTAENDVLSTAIELPDMNALGYDDTITAHIEGYRNIEADMAAAKVDFADAGWNVASLMGTDEIMAGVASMRNQIILIALALLAGAIVLSTWFSRTITRPIDSLVDEMKQLADGNTDIALDGKDRKDEVGDMVRSVAIFRDGEEQKRRLEAEAEESRTLSEKERADREAARAEEHRRTREAVDALAGGLTSLAEGDLSVQLNQPFVEELDGLRVNFNASVTKLNGTLGRIREKSQSIDANSREVRSASDDLSRRTEQQAASLEETSAALEQITATIKETSGNSTEVATLANTAKSDTDRSAEVVGKAASAMADIEKASGEITNIINVIDEIAFQTNLLALNAGVEAARAGEAGQGFAVVAQEVRELAQRTAVAAKEIKGLITKSGEEVSNGVELVNKTRDALSHIAEVVSEIDGRIQGIATASAEQLTGVQEINVAVGQIDEVTQKNAAMVEETTAVSHSLAGDVESLSAMISEFRLSETAFTGPRAVGDETPRPAVAPASPARKLVQSISSAFGGKGAAAAATTANDDWEEF